MLVGILSDSHGDHLVVRKAMSLFDRLGAAHIIHCGDVCGSDVFDEIVGRPCTFVWGNCDCPSNGLIGYLRSVDLPPPSDIPAVVTLDRKRFAVFHGHELQFATDLLRLDVDYVCHGHTHVRRDERVRGKRIINPGALYRANPRTVATLDTQADELTFHEIDRLQYGGP